MDWKKYMRFKEEFKNLQSKFSLSEEDYDELYDVAYNKFERKFDATVSDNEGAFLRRTLINKIKDYLKQKQPMLLTNEEKGMEEAFDFELIPPLSQEDFVRRCIAISGFKEEDLKGRYRIVENHLKNTIFPLIKLKAWFKPRALSQNTLEELTSEIEADLKSESYFDWLPPFSVVKIQTWLSLCQGND